MIQCNIVNDISKSLHMEIQQTMVCFDEKGVDCVTNNQISQRNKF